MTATASSRIWSPLTMRSTAHTTRFSSMWASKVKAAPDELQMFRREDIHVIGGGETNGYCRIMGCNDQKTVPVDEWH